jgi:hypothetical protein
MIDVEATLYGLSISGSLRGREFTGCCPMHEQRTGKPDSHPSWSINVDTGLFNCFSCGYRGTILTLISDLKGVSVDEAKGLTIRPDLQVSLSRIPGAYKSYPKPEPINEATLFRFVTPPRWARDRRNLTKDACEAYGVRWNLLTESWITPIRDPFDNSLMGWQEKSETDRSFNNYPTGVRKSSALFGYDIFTSGRMVVVESPLDAVRLMSEGVYGAVATYGAIVSKQQVMLMSAADEVVFALDNPSIDPAGLKASTQLLHETKGVLKSVKFFNYSGISAKDPGDMTPTEITQGLSTARSRAFGERAIA